MPRNEDIRPAAQKPDADRNEGEGSRSADAAYKKGLERFQREGRVDASAEEAERALTTEEGEELERAEQRGKAGPQTN